MATALDLLLVDQFTAGINAPGPLDDGKLARVAVDGSGRANLEYVKLTNAIGRGVYYVDDYGAVSIGFTDTHPATDAAIRTTNVAAINACFAAAMAAGGGTIRFSPGVYYINAAIGFELNLDANVNLIITGAGAIFATLISSSSSTEPCMKLHQSNGNIRSVFLQDISFLGGRTGLSLVRCDYSRFNRIWFWGADQFAVQMYGSFNNVFDQCYWTETGFFGDSLMAINSKCDLAYCTFGESGGGIYSQTSTLSITGGAIFGSRMRGKPYTDYWTDPDNPTTQTLTYDLSVDAPTIVAADSGLLMSNVELTTQTVGVYSYYGSDISITGCHFYSGDETTGSADFKGFIRNWSDGRSAFSITGGQFKFRNAGPAPDAGFFFQDVLNNVHDALIQTQVILDVGTSMTAISSSAPKLLNPGTENNTLLLKTLQRV